MRAIYASFTVNVATFALKALSAAYSSSSAVNAELYHSLGDLVGSGLLAAGALFMGRSPSIKYPFGYGRSIYVFGLLSSLAFGGLLFAASLGEGIARLASLSAVTASQAASLALLAAAVADVGVLAWGVGEYLTGLRDPATKGVIVENISDSIGDAAALTSIALRNPYIDAYGAFTVSAFLLVSSISLGYRYFNVLVGSSAPRNVVGRAIKVAVSIPYIVDVNDVKSLVVGPDEYLVIMQVEVPPHLSAEDVEVAREELRERLLSAEPRIKYLVVEFVTPKAPEGSFRKLLADVVKLG